MPVPGSRDSTAIIRRLGHVREKRNFRDSASRSEVVPGGLHVVAGQDAPEPGYREKFTMNASLANERTG